MHKHCEENVKNELSNSKSTKMPYQQKEELKHVFVMDPAYEDISSDEKFTDEILINTQSIPNMCEDIASDDEFNGDNGILYGLRVLELLLVFFMYNTLSLYLNGVRS